MKTNYLKGNVFSLMTMIRIFNLVICFCPWVLLRLFPITSKLIIDGLFEERLDNDANVKNKIKKCQVYLFLLELDKLYTKTLDKLSSHDLIKWLIWKSLAIYCVNFIVLTRSKQFQKKNLIPSKQYFPRIA